MAVNIPRRSVFIAIGVGTATLGLGVDTHMHWHEERQPGTPQLAVNGNPLDNLRLLDPYDADLMILNGKPVPNDTPIGPTNRVENVHAGDTEWTINDSIPYHVPTLLVGVRAIVATARADRSRANTPNH